MADLYHLTNSFANEEGADFRIAKTKNNNHNRNKNKNLKNIREKVIISNPSEKDQESENLSNMTFNNK